MRTVAVYTAVLSPLFCEKDFALPGRVATQAKVKQSLVEASSAARHAAESYASALDATWQKKRERVPEEEAVLARPGQALPHRDAVHGAVLCVWLDASAGPDLGHLPSPCSWTPRVVFGFLPEVADRYCAGVRRHGCTHPLQHGDGLGQVDRCAIIVVFSSIYFFLLSKRHVIVVVIE